MCARSPKSLSWGSHAPCRPCSRTVPRFVRRARGLPVPRGRTSRRHRSVERRGFAERRSRRLAARRRADRRRRRIPGQSRSRPGANQSGARIAGGLFRAPIHRAARNCIPPVDSNGRAEQLAEQRFGPRAVQRFGRRAQSADDANRHDKLGRSPAAERRARLGPAAVGMGRQRLGNARRADLFRGRRNPRRPHPAPGGRCGHRSNRPQPHEVCDERPRAHSQRRDGPGGQRRGDADWSEHRAAGSAGGGGAVVRRVADDRRRDGRRRSGAAQSEPVIRQDCAGVVESGQLLRNDVQRQRGEGVSRLAAHAVGWQFDVERLGPRPVQRLCDVLADRDSQNRHEQLPRSGASAERHCGGAAWLGMGRQRMGSAGLAHLLRWLRHAHDPRAAAGGRRGDRSNRRQPGRVSDLASRLAARRCDRPAPGGRRGAGAESAADGHADGAGQPRLLHRAGGDHAHRDRGRSGKQDGQGRVLQRLDAAWRRHDRAVQLLRGARFQRERISSRPWRRILPAPRRRPRSPPSPCRPLPCRRSGSRSRRRPRTRR